MPLQITNPLHLYRAIFRETTYLFDKNARSWTQAYVRSCFRRHAGGIRDGKYHKTIPFDPHHVPSWQERYLLKRGRKFHRLLLRANQGYQRYLRSILEMTYGRKGRRKVALTTSLIRPCLPSNANLLTEAATTDAPPVRYSRDWEPPDEFMSLLKVQNHLKSWLSIRYRIKLKPEIGQTNRWDKPMPLARVRNKNRVWYARMAKIIMPPLPEEEWKRIKEIALCRQELRSIPRRPEAKRVPEIRQIEEAEHAAKLILSGVDKPLLRLQATSMMNPHELTPRFVSRLYAKSILNHSSVAVPNPQGKGLISKWDNGKRNIIAAEKPSSAAQAEALFE